MSEPWAQNSKQLTLFAEAFPVSRIALLADEAVLRTSATSGRSSPELFASVGLGGWSQRTSQGYFPQRLDGSLARFSETWPRAGMTRNGTAYRQVPSAPLTDAIASGSWPTPDAGAFNLHESPESVQARREVQLQKHRNGNGFGLRLATAAQLWPTPCTTDAANVPYQKGKHGQRYPMLLGAVRPETMWPTPPAITDTGGAAMCKWGGSGARAKLRTMTTSQELNGALNPQWVSWLMGYPVDWCDLPAGSLKTSRTASKSSPASAIASCRKSRNGSRTASAPPKGCDI